MAFVYHYQSIQSSGVYKLHRHRATLELINSLNGIARLGSMLAVPEQLVVDGVYKLPLVFQQESPVTRAVGLLSHCSSRRLSKRFN